MLEIVLAIRAIAPRAVNPSRKALTVELEAFGVLAVAVPALLLTRKLSALKYFPD